MRKCLLLFLALILGGCVHAVSEQSRSLVDRSITFPALRENPEAHAGKYVMIGGAIATVRNTREESQLEVVQLPLDSSDMPEETFNTGGRFLAITNKFLDPLIYKQGRMVTIVGDIKGKKVKPIDQVDYIYPVIGIREIHLWRPSDTDRQTGYPGYAYPYYWYDPWWPYWYYRPGPFRPWY